MDLDQFETGVATDTILLEALDDSSKRFGWRKDAAIHGSVDGEAKGPFGPGSRLKCMDFGWVQSWASTMASPYGGKATMEYLKNP